VEPRIIGLQERAPYEALQGARQRQRTEEFRQQYAARAGVEGTRKRSNAVACGSAVTWERRRCVYNMY
jgi:hypothetical protein